MLDVAREVVMKPPSQGELVSIKDAMRTYGLLYHQIRYAINTGKIPSWKQGNRILILVADAERLAQARQLMPYVPPNIPPDSSTE